MTEPIGFVGLGIMGKPMARRLLAAGFDITVHSRSPGPVDELAAEGAKAAPSPAAVAAGSGVVITMLPDTPDVELVLFRDGGVASELRKGSLLVDMSTIDPLATRRFAERIRSAGSGMLDAPVSGGERGAIDGTLSIMIGGSEEDVRRAMPLFEAMGSTIVHVGGAGAGQVAKACNQLVVGSTIQTVAEALALAEAAGVDAEKVREALLGGFAGSKVLDVHGRRMLDGSFAPGFRARLHLKDARIVLATAGELDSPVPAFEVAAAAFQRLVDEGGGELDHAALYSLIAPRDGRRRGAEAGGS
jgi:2-hydroxy-3-oxopropionate reductase